MTDEELLAIAEDAEAEIRSTTITFADWINRIRTNKNYKYQDTAWWRALQGLNNPDKTSFLAILDAAERDLQEETPQPQPNKLVVGICIPQLPYSWLDVLGPNLDAARSALGPITIRTDFAYTVLKNNNANWFRTDRFMLETARRGMRIYPNFSYVGAEWNGVSSDKYPPKPEFYDNCAELIAASFRRYGVGGEFWKLHPEITPLPLTEFEGWNEPWLDAFWRPHAEPAAHNALHQVIFDKVLTEFPHLKMHVQLDHFVQGPGNANNPLTPGQKWDEAVLKASPNSYLRDPRVYPSVHTYCEGAAPLADRGDDGWEGDRWRVARLVCQQQGFGDKPISVTEFGWRTPTGETNPGPVSDQTGADYTQTALTTMVADNYVTHAFYFHLGLTSDTWTYNIRRPDGSFKPVAAVLKSFAQDPAAVFAKT